MDVAASSREESGSLLPATERPEPSFYIQITYNNSAGDSTSGRWNLDDRRE